MLYIKYLDENIKILNTESDEVVDTSTSGIVSVAEDLKRKYKEEAILGVVASSVYEPSVSGIKAMQFIDYKNCVPIFMPEKHVPSGFFKRLNLLNFYNNNDDKYLSLGDIAIMAMSSKEKSSDSYYVKDDYLYILIDESRDHYTYFKYRILDCNKLSRLAVKCDVMGKL